MELKSGGHMRSPGSYPNWASSALHVQSEWFLTVFWSECGLFSRDWDECTAHVFKSVKAGVFCGFHPHARVDFSGVPLSCACEASHSVIWFLHSKVRMWQFVWLHGSGVDESKKNVANWLLLTLKSIGRASWKVKIQISVNLLVWWSKTNLCTLMT